MELARNFAKFYDEFQEEIAKLQTNLNDLNELRKSIDSATGWLKTDKNKWLITLQVVQQLRDIMKHFNDGTDAIFDEHNTNGNEDNGCSIDMQQRLDGGKCQITEIVDSKNCICYAVDLNGKTVSRLKTFWKEAQFLRLEPFDDEDSALNDIFGIEFESKLNRAKFMFDSTINSVRIRLIDTGEVVEHGQFNLQKLPHDVKSLPAAALQCKINRIGGAAALSLPRTLKGQIFDYQICTNDKSNDMLCIDIRPTNPFLMGIDTVIQNALFGNVVDDNNGPFASNDFDSDDDDNMNMEQTMDQTFQRKWNEVAESSKKILNTNSMCDSNHTLSHGASNGFQLVKNRNRTTSNGGKINQGFTSDWDDDNGAAAGATSIAMDQHPTIQSTEKSAPNENYCGGAISLNANHGRYNRYKTGNKSSTRYGINNNNNFAAGQPWSNDRQRQSSSALFERMRPMKTQCETTIVQSNHTKLNRAPRVGEPITIIPTHVLNAKEFYGQLGVHFHALQYSQKRLNYRRCLAQNEPYCELPAEGELVLVLLEDGTFYRARILSASNNHEILVFLLDYGTTYKVELHFIYKWTKVCNEFPFYSVVFSLGNLQLNMNGSEMGGPAAASALAFVKSKIAKTFTLAEVIAVDDHSISVRIFDDNGYDIGEEINCLLIKSTGAGC